MAKPEFWELPSHHPLPYADNDDDDYDDINDDDQDGDDNEDDRCERKRVSLRSSLERRRRRRPGRGEQLIIRGELR